MRSKAKLSKSQYIKGLQCPKALWFYRHRKDLKQAPAPAIQARFDEGHKTGKLAMQYFEGGVEVTVAYWETAKAVSSTQNFIKAGHEIIFEATAVHPGDGSYSRIDILRKRPSSDEWDLIEVKNSVELKYYHIDDMAFQYYVFSAAGYKIHKCLMMLLDGSYLPQGEPEAKKLFKLADISSEVFARQVYVDYWAAQLSHVLERKNEPDAQIGERCFKPFECDYRHHCWKQIPK